MIVRCYVLCLALIGFAVDSVTAQSRLDINQTAKHVFPVIKSEAATTEANKRNRRANIDPIRHIDSWAFNRHGNAAAAKIHLEGELAAQLAQIQRVAELESADQEKLLAAGRHDIAMFFSGIEEIKAKYKRNDAVPQQLINEIWQLVQPFQARMQGDFFGRDSLLLQVAYHGLPGEQAVKYRKWRDAVMRRKYRQQIQSAILVLENHTLLTAKQRQQIIDILLDTDPPRIDGQHIYYYVLYQCSQRQDQINEVLSPGQQKALKVMFQQGKGMVQFLRQQGYLDAT